MPLLGLTFAPFHMAPLKTIVYICTYACYTHTDSLSLHLRLSFIVSFIVDFLHSGQLLPFWRHTNKQPTTP